MKETINVFDYEQTILKALPQGILLNTKEEKFNAMVIGWGALGIAWNLPVFSVLVRENRYTKARLDRTGEFTISIPINGPSGKIVKVCGSLSGRRVDKVAEAGLTLEEPRTNGVPGIAEYPLTLECKILYSQWLDPAGLPEELRAAMYPEDVSGSDPGVNRDPHTAYIAQVVDAYIIK